MGSFKALKQYADFDITEDEVDPSTPEPDGTNSQTPPTPRTKTQPPTGIQLGYTVNLNLPATNDIGVYDAIFKSLKEHLLD